MRSCKVFNYIRCVRRSASGDRSAVTALEILVCIVVVTILLAIVIPAVQSVRETSRRMSCVNQQRQLGVALQAFVATHRRFPSDNENCFSWHVAILPIIEQQSLYDEIRETGKDCWAPVAVPGLEALQNNFVPLFHCPSETDRNAAITNYLGNAGSGFYKAKNGTFSRKPATAADFKDGLSNTAAVSEFLGGWNKHPIEPLDVTAETLEQWKTEFVPACEVAVPSGRYPGALIGSSWLRPGHVMTVYSHILPPGNNSCDSDGKGITMVTTPRSNHPGGVNLLMADGSYQFAASSMDTSVWRKIGARDDSVSIWEN